MKEFPVIGLALAMAVLVPHRVLAAGPAPVDLGSAAHFAILAGSTISSTGGGSINGDVGLSPGVGSKITGLLTNQVNGIIYAVDGTGPVGSVVDTGMLSTARADFYTAYNDAAGRTVNKITLGADENLGGQTLAPGLYWSSSSLQITGNLTLTGGPDDVWIFQMGSTLTTADGSGNSRVILAGGAQSRNIFWQVGSSATIGTFSVFKGTILAAVDITMGTSCTVEGRALAAGNLTFNGQGINQSPTPVVLLHLGAMAQDGRVTVRWSTSSETKTAGFDLYRLVDGQWSKLNATLIPAQGWPNGGVGASYAVADPGAAAGGTYTYKLVERTTDGQSIDYGPYERLASEFAMRNPVESTAEGVMVRWLSRAGEHYRVMKCTNLVGNQYQPIAENIEATPQENACLDTNVSVNGFYRIELQQP